MRKRVRFPLLLSFCLLCNRLPLLASGPSQADLLARLTAAQEADNLNDPALKPWHMLVTFDLLEPSGKVKEHGTFEEWWAAPNRWHRRINSPSFTQDLFRAGDQSLSASPSHLPYFLGILAQQLVAPIPSFPPDFALSIAQQTKSFGQVQLDCFLVQSAKSRYPSTFGITPTYCLDQQRPNLRFFMEGNVQQISRNRSGLFQDKAIASDITIEMAGHTALHATLDQLQGGKLVEADLTPPANLPASPIVARVSSGVVTGMKIGGERPHYPQEAKMRHVSGAVLLRALIGTDGHIYNLEPIWSPDTTLTNAATEAVRTWTYQPYLLNGKPTEVETTITVNFSSQ